MRQKILTILLFIFAGVMSMAAADYSGFYRFKGPRSGRFAIDNGTTFKIGSSSSVTKGNLSEIWEIRAMSSGAYAVINAGTGRMIQAQPATQKEHSTSATACSPFYIKKNGTKYIVSSTADFSGYSCWHEDGSNRIVVWNDSETNSQWAFTTVTGEDLAAAKEAIAGYDAAISKAIADASKMSILETGGIFRLKSRYDHYASENASHAVVGAAEKKTNDLSQIWIIEKGSSSFSIRNASSGRYLPDNAGADVALVTTTEPTNYYIKTSAYSTDYFTISWKSDFSGTNCLHENSKGNIVKWNANNANNGVQYSDWSIEPVDEADTEATIENLRRHIAEMQGIATELTTGTYRLVPAIYPDRALTEDSSKGVTTVLRNDRYSQVWRLTVSADGKTCTMQNVLSDNYVRNSAAQSAQFKTQTSATSSTSFTIGTASSKFDVFFNFQGSAQGFHCAKSSNYNVVGWSASDNASQWILYKAEIDEAALANEKAEVEAGNAMQANAAAYNEKLQKYFDDYACTSLRSDYLTSSPAELRSAMTADELPEVLQNMAVSILTGVWEADKDETYNDYVRRFRIQDVQCYSDNVAWQKITNVGPFGELTSPTGIQGKIGQYVYIFVDEAPKTGSKLRALLAYDTEYRNKGELQLKRGLNVWQLPADGEVFINYFCTDTNKYLADFPNIRVHVEGASVNGYWDLSRGMTNADWAWLKANMFKGEFLHVKGCNTVLNVLLDKVKSATKPVEIMKGWDFAFLGLQRAIGHDGQWDGRYNPVVNPRHSYSGNPNWGGYGGSNHTSITSSYLFNYDNFYQGNVWEILHEIGHGCQYPIRMAGTTEVTNNSLAQIVNYMMGRNCSRGNGTDKLVQLFNYADPSGSGLRGWSWTDYTRYADPHYDASLHTGNHLFYQLYLYFDVMGHCPGFTARLHDELRANPIITGGKASPGKYYEDYWRVAEAAAKVSQTDLWDFFNAYGFWKYYDEVISTRDEDNDATFQKNGVRFIGDYGNYYMYLPVRGKSADDKRRSDLEAYMRSMPHKAPNLFFIDDHAEKGTVRDDSFVAEIVPSLAGQDLLDYWNIPVKPDYGQYIYFDGQDRGEGIRFSIGSTNYTQSFKTDKGGSWDYSITGRKVTMNGKGILGVKIYAPDGSLAWIANSKTFAIPTEMANGIKDGSYKLCVAVTAEKEVALAPGEVYTADADGITAPALSPLTSETYYDLQGRRNVRPAAGGVYVKDGVKVVGTR